MNKLSEDLKACPFCGSSGEEVSLSGHLRASGHNDGWNVRCYVCHVETAYEDSEAEAIAAWNRRSEALSSPGGQGNGSSGAESAADRGPCPSAPPTQHSAGEATAWDRSRACLAASVASQRFGTWVPQAWLTLFFDAYEAQR